MGSYGSDPFEDSPNPWESEDFPAGEEAYPAAAYPAQGKNSNAIPILLGALGAIIVIAAAALFFILRGNSEDAEPTDGAMNTVTVEATTVVNDPTLDDLDSGDLDSEDPEATKDPTETEDPDASSDRERPSSDPRASRDNAPTPEEDLPGGDLSVVTRGTSVTSDPFALSVAKEYREFRDRTGELSGTIRAYSEVTSMTYNMTCTPVDDEVVCRGGNNAVVIISGK